MQNREKRGDHRFHVACKYGAGMSAYSVTLSKGERTRAAEEAVCATAILAVACHHGGVPDAEIPAWPSLPGLAHDEAVQAAHVATGDPVAALLRGDVHCVEFSGPPEARQIIVDAPRANAVLLPGSFNPLHNGHMCAR
jgi:hypothetical protein